MVSTKRVIDTLAGLRMAYAPVPSQLSSREVVVLPGEETGMVLCPLKKSGIAEMRCVEYQRDLGCAAGCPNAVKPERAKELKQGMRYGGRVHNKEGKELFDTCGLCGREKRPTTFDRCPSC